jgi:hypothetical protein
MQARYSKCETRPFRKDGFEIRWTKYPGEFNLYVWVMRMQHHWRVRW